jgi:WS/DGAT/MGAT family acyltransferase
VTPTPSTAGDPSSRTPPSAQRLSAVDVAWLRMDEPANLMQINGILAVDQPITLAAVKRVVARRLVTIKRFNQRVDWRGTSPWWVFHEGFDLDQHVREVTLPDPGGDHELGVFAGRMLSEALDPTRPLWDVHVLQNYQGRTVLYVRIHHAIGDGVALMMVLLSLTDLTADGGRPTAEMTDADLELFDEAGPNPFVMLFRHPLQAAAAARQLATEVMPDTMRLMLNPIEAMKKTGRVLKTAGMVTALGRLVFRPRDPKSAFKGPLVVEKRAAWSRPIVLEEVKRVGKALGGTVNDVLLAAMAGGLRRYLVSRGELPEAEAVLNFRAAMPVNLRPIEEMAELGNRFGLIFLSLPIGIADPRARVAELKRRANALKKSAEPWVAFGVLKSLGLVPHAVQRMVVGIFATKATAVMTNVPGPRQTLYFAGSPIKDVFFWVPQSGRVGLGVSICSYDGHVRLGVGTDAGLVPDPELVVSGFHDEWDAMCKLAAG